MTQAIDGTSFRRAMGQFATGITVVTAMDAEGREYGITANSFTSVSLEPPLVLVCVGRDLDFGRVISEAHAFNISILNSAQEDHSRRFSTRGIDRFAGLEYDYGHNGVPLLRDVLGTIECDRYDVLPGGDHIIVLGRVTRLQVATGEPLIYFSGGYRFLA